MSQIKPFELNADKVSDKLKAMAHPIRLSILNLLKDGKILSVSYIHENLGLEQSVTSHHLGILRNKGLVCTKREGKNNFYFVKHPLIAQIIECMQTCACEE